jgi:hypothetical protein
LKKDRLLGLTLLPLALGKPPPDHSQTTGKTDNRHWKILIVATHS